MKKRPGSVWALRKMGLRPQGYVEEAPDLVDGQRGLVISLHLSQDKEKDGFAFVLSRSTARLLARRIEQCLEETA